MATKSDFNSAEWSQLLAAPLLAGMAVSVAEPSGLLGMLQEGWANARSMAKAGTDPSASELAKAITSDLATSDGRTAAHQFVKERLTAKSAADLKPQIIQALADIAATIDQKAGSDGVAIKAWLNQTAQAVADASREGGFIGFGGVAVSDAEKATLDEVAKALQA
jgi:hypothetical protein